MKWERKSRALNRSVRYPFKPFHQDLGRRHVKVPMLRHGSKRNSARPHDHLLTLDTCELVLRHLEILWRLDDFSLVDLEFFDCPGHLRLVAGIKRVLTAHPGAEVRGVRVPEIALIQLPVGCLLLT